MSTCSADYHLWYQRLFPRLQGRGVWLRGDGLNVLPPSEFHRRPCRVLIARLSSWYDTGASLSHRMVYRIAAGVEGVYPDVAYLPPPQDRPLFESDSVPWLLGISTKAGPDAFHCVAFSNAIVQELVNLPHMLARSGLPLHMSERLARADVPLVILGGANAAAAAGLLAGDSLVDGVFVGGAEESIMKVFETIRDCVVSGADKSTILKRLSTVPGFAVCGAVHTGEPVPAALGPEPPPGRAPVWAHPEQMGIAHVTVTDGCPYACTFCFECWLHRPYRERDPAAVEAEARAAVQALAAEHIELYGYSVSSHRRFGAILCALAGMAPSIGLKSQRLDVVAREPNLPAALRAIAKTSFTVGIEGISERLRNYLDKRLPEQVLRAGLAALLEAGVRELKLFLIATGLEEKNDFEQFRDLLAFVREYIRAGKGCPRVIVSVTPLVCFPWTPLEFADAPTTEACRKALSGINAAVRDAGFEYRESARPDEQFVSQVLARPFDHRVADALIECSLKSGFVYDRRITEQYADALKSCLTRHGLAPAELLTGFGPESRRQRPWRIVNPALDPHMLAERFRRCETTLAGVVPNQSATAAPSVCPPDPAAIEAAVRRRRERSCEVALIVDVREKALGLPRRMVGMALAQALMDAAPELALAYDGYRGSVWGVDDNPCQVSGDDIITLGWQREAAERLRADTVLLSLADRHLREWGALKGVWSGPRPCLWYLRFVSAHRCDPDRFLAFAHLKATRRRTTESWYEYVLNPQSLKRGVLRRLAVRTEANGVSEVRVEAPETFPVEDFVREALAGPYPLDSTRISVHATITGEYRGR